MLFNSIVFAIFLPIVFVCYWLLRKCLSAQNLLLLVASYVFYGWWDWRYLFLIAGCSVVNFIAGRIIYESKNLAIKRIMLFLCCMVCLGVLGVFKYYNFFVESFAALFAQVGIHWSPIVLNLALPVGISFFTFQALSYTIDIYRGNLIPTKSWIDFFVFISFFPQLVAGPIERATNLLPQFQTSRKFDFDSATHGICLMSYGLFKKMVVADSLSQYVDRIWCDPLFNGSIACALAVVFFSVQIYCDFSGYSDVARGVAKLFGFNLMLNFDRPYLSKSFGEFWRRWHISLSSWFKDYVYIPLGGNRVSLGKLLRNIWVVFLLSGLWHGASWAFVMWGGLHALYLTIGTIKRHYFSRGQKKGWMHDLMNIFIVDLGVVFAWIFFRSGSLAKSYDFIAALTRCQFELSSNSLFGGFSLIRLSFCFTAIGLLALSYLCPRDCLFKKVSSRFVFSSCCIFAISLIGMPSGGEFIYFRF